MILSCGTWTSSWVVLSVFVRWNTKLGETTGLSATCYISFLLQDINAQRSQVHPEVFERVQGVVHSVAEELGPFEEKIYHHIMHFSRETRGLQPWSLRHNYDSNDGARGWISHIKRCLQGHFGNCLVWREGLKLVLLVLWQMTLWNWCSHTSPTRHDRWWPWKK